MDFHDEEIVMWRSNELGTVEDFCSSNILNAAPKRFRYGIWYSILGISTVLSLIGSAILGNISPWISNMLGNIASGLIASLILLLFTGAKEQNIDFYDQLLPKLSEAIECLDRAFNMLYWEDRKLREEARGVIRNPQLVLEKHRVFSMKAFLTHKTLADILRQISDSDRLKYKSIHIPEQELDDYEKQIEAYENMIALDYSKAKEEHREDYEKAYLALEGKEHQYMRLLKNYKTEIERNEIYWKYHYQSRG